VYPRGRTPPARSELPRHLDLGNYLDRTPPYDPHEPMNQRARHPVAPTLVRNQPKSDRPHGRPIRRSIEVGSRVHPRAGPIGAGRPRSVTGSHLRPFPPQAVVVCPDKLRDAESVPDRQASRATVPVASGYVCRL
jgi:hypothetical protein